jgi:predicted RNase H-like HicB family nuclease
MNSKIADLIKRPYTRMLIPDPDGGFVGEVKELPGCLTQGETEKETLANLSEAMELWLEAAFKQGLAIPEPEIERRYSGKLLLRLPKSLHKKLADAAESDGVSINQWIVSALSERAGGQEIADFSMRKGTGSHKPYHLAERTSSYQKRR